MTLSRQKQILSRFIDKPPVLMGDLMLEIEPIDETHALILIASDGHRFRGRAAALTVSYPSGLQRLLAADPTVEVVLVEHASKGLESAARQANVGYLDLHGRGHLEGPGFVYVVPAHTTVVSGTDVDVARTRAAKLKAPKVSPFAPKASRIVRALLSEPTRSWKLTELATPLEMNPGNVHRVLNALAEIGLVERDHERYVVPDSGSLLEAWAENTRRSRASERLTVHVGDDLVEATHRVLAMLDGHGAVSGELAAELYAPFLPSANVLIHCVEATVWDSERLTDAFGPTPLRARKRVILDLADAGVADFGVEREGLPLVAPQQLYVDLYSDRGRGREAGEHVRREVLRI